MVKSDKLVVIMWRILAKALGEKSGISNTESDRIAIIRLVIISQSIITNMFIISGIIKHWSD